MVNRTNQTALIPDVPVTVRSTLAILFRRKALVLGLFTFLCLMVVTVTWITRTHESRMRILVKNERADLVVSAEERNGLQPRTDVTESQVNSEIEILTSNDLLSKVVAACHLYGDKSYENKDASEVPAKSFERAVRKLRGTLSIIPIRKTNVIEITYSSRRPELAASVLKELASVYLDAHLRAHKSPGTTEFFRAQALSYESQLRDLKDELSSFRRKNDITSIAEEKDLLVRKALDLQGSLEEVEATLAETSTRAGELRRQVLLQQPRIETQKHVVPNQSSIERLNTMLADLENRRTEALVKFLPEDRIIAELNNELSNTRAALDRAVKFSSVEQTTDVNPLYSASEGDLSRAEPQAAGLRSRRKSLAGILGTYRARLAQLEKITTEHDTLVRRAKESEDNYLLYARKREEARIADSLDQQKISNVAIVEQPTAQYLAAPGTLLILCVGTVFAGLVSVGAAFGAEYFRPVFHTPAELQTGTGLRILAAFPLNEEQKKLPLIYS